MVIPLITTPEKLPSAIAESVSAEEKEWIEKVKTRGLPFAVTSHFASLAGPDKSDPIRQQFMPSPLEEQRGAFALDDPLGETHYRITPRLIHQYSDRVLLLAGGTCAGFCRYCFRRVRMSSPASFITDDELKPVLAWLKTRSGIREILVSGGDPLTARDGEIEELFIKLREARPGILIRLCSRVPVTCPERLSPDTITLLSRYQPLRIVTQINHPRELGHPANKPVSGMPTGGLQQAQTVLALAAKAGIPVLVQTVLLRGVNDNAETLAALFRDCVSLGLIPYYLFQLDLAPGTAHFMVPLKEGLSIYRELSRLLPGNSLPVYAVDLPGGGGKIHLCEEKITGEEDSSGGRVYLLEDETGRLWKYPIGPN